jgi:hypothetical protein
MLSFQAMRNIMQDERTQFERAVDILAQTHSRAATDPRDKIYSMIDLLNLELQIDYSKTVEVVYMDISRLLVSKVYLGELLDDAGLGDGLRKHDLPSWVVDWDALSSLRFKSRLQRGHYLADRGFSQPAAMPRLDGYKLQVFGAVFDVIKAVAPFKALDEDDSSVEDIEQEVLSFCLHYLPFDGATSRPSGVSRLIVAFCSLCQDIDITTGQRLDRTSPSFIRALTCFIHHETTPEDLNSFGIQPGSKSYTQSPPTFPMKS